MDMTLFFGGLFLIWTVVYFFFKLRQLSRNKREQDKLGRIWERYRDNH